MRKAEHKKLELSDGRRIAYRQWKGRGRPLVLLHGLLDSSAGWERLAGEIGRPVIAFDLPGFGGSSLPEHATTESYAADIKQALELLEVRDFILGGHSLGGAVASALAAQSDEVNRLLLFAPAGYGRTRLAELLDAPGISQIARLCVPLTVANPLLVNLGYAALVSNHKLPSVGLSKRLMAGAPTCANGASYAIRVLSRRSRHPFERRDLRRHRGPVLAVWGERDLLVPTSQIAQLRRALPQAEVVELPGIAHHPQHEAPEQVLELVEGFAGGRRIAAARTSAARPRTGGQDRPAGRLALA